MTDVGQLPVVTLFRSGDCSLCDDAEALIRDELARRTGEGQPSATLDLVDISTIAAFEERYRSRIPVLALGDAEVGPVTAPSQVRDFLDRVLAATRA
jgi:hypothetical protein